MGLLALACALALAPTFNFGARPPAAAVEPQAGSVGAEVRSLLAAEDPEGLAPIYRQRGYQPLWITGAQPGPVAYRLAGMLAGAADDGLDPHAYGAARIAAELPQARTPAELARLELELSRAFAAYAGDLREPPPAAELALTDRDLAHRRLTPELALAAAARAPSLDAHLLHLRPQNPVYAGLRAALAAHRAARPPGSAPDSQERTLALNLARARALPPDADASFVLVDAASAQLWLYEDGQVRQTMPVAVGKLTEPTPLMAGVIRYAVYQPYWNVPPDLVRKTYAPRVLKAGLGYLADAGFEVLSDWSDHPTLVDPASVDWAAVAAGQATVRLRQRPGPRNMMGAVKLMLPNSFGVYLHDTPDKSVFAHASRNFSAGCVRLSDAQALALRLGAAPPTAADPSPERRVDLPRPMSVYIAYFTALPRDGGVAFARDAYGRDAPLLAQMDGRRGAGAMALAGR
ncbi:MAG TPA: L,D-transpeptidase family protein [Phenylobacterium sp.]